MRMPSLPVIDIAPMLSGEDPHACGQVATQIGDACRAHGFFYIAGHGIDEALQTTLRDASSMFFALPEAEKMRVAMRHGGRAWRGYFPVGGELTSGRPDLKEGLYFGTRTAAGRSTRSSRMAAAWRQSMAGASRWRCAKRSSDYTMAATRAAQAVLAAMALSLGLEADWFRSTTPPIRPCCSGFSATRHSRPTTMAGASASIPITAC